MQISEYNDYFWLGVRMLLSILLILNLKRIIKAFSGEDGVLDKKELAGMVFLTLFVYMVIKEGKEAELQVYSNYLYAICAIVTLTALGFDNTLNAIRDTIVVYKTGQLKKETHGNIR